MTITRSDPFVYHLAFWAVFCSIGAAIWFAAGILEEIATGSRAVDRRWMRSQKTFFRGRIPAGPWRSSFRVTRLTRVFVLVLIVVATVNSIVRMLIGPG